MLWLKAFHIIFLVAWFAGLFYLPRLFAYHCEVKDAEGNERFKRMERKLFRIIMTPAAIITTIFGIWMLGDYAWAAYSKAGWLHAKLGLIVLLYVYHFLCWRWMRAFQEDRNTRPAKFYKIMNEVPTLFLIIITILVVVKPF